MMAAWVFLKSRAGQTLAAAVAIVLTLLAAYAAGYEAGARAEREKQAKREAAAEAVARKRERAAEKVSRDVAEDLVREVVRVETVTKTLVKEVPVYVTPDADARCVVPAGFVQHHDAAAAGQLPEPPGRSVDADSGLELSAVSETVAFNYGLANAWRAEVIAWRTWYEQQSKVAR